ncbi:hypothetical protein [Butyrivibrio proteoclasticus]|uniref:hypothetical protein n=1 Tax=Butyrivibrio proteoclasticus TaxID=43305 RepID=UPI000478B67E|nr:hypothetical protein [Butyrivibrio proteoclasticus]
MSTMCFLGKDKDCSVKRYPTSSVEFVVVSTDDTSYLCRSLKKDEDASRYESYTLSLDDKPFIVLRSDPNKASVVNNAKRLQNALFDLFINADSEKRGI